MTCHKSTVCVLAVCVLLCSVHFLNSVASPIHRPYMSRRPTASTRLGPTCRQCQWLRSHRAGRHRTRQLNASCFGAGGSTSTIISRRCMVKIRPRRGTGCVAPTKQQLQQHCRRRFRPSWHGLVSSLPVRTGTSCFDNILHSIPRSYSTVQYRRTGSSSKTESG